MRRSACFSYASVGRPARPRLVHHALTVGEGSREDWERRWATTPEGDFDWFVGNEAPVELAEALARVDLPAGAALDVGCGSGNITVLIAERFRPTVGFDITLSAIRIARARGGDGRHFIVAASPDFPFPDGAFAFIFDRGCLQHVPRPAWPVYFASVQRMLVPGGIVELMIPAQPPPRALSIRGIRARIARMRGRRGSSRMVPMERAIRHHVPSGMLIEKVRTSPVHLPGGAHLIFTHAVLRKAPASASSEP
jgi:SAM-dependent methyltransferase